jgi:hypothetical protein
LHIPHRNLEWAPSFRVIASRYPAINFFERITADPKEWEILLEIERMTDPTFDVGDLSMLETPDRIGGAGAGRVLPSFTFLDPNPPGGRFSNSQFGAYYAAGDFDTAVAETVHHRTAFMASTSQPAQDLDQLLILADIKGSMHDIRAMRAALAPVYAETDYAASQALAQKLRSDGSLGIVYDSVRRPDGECIALLRARAVSNAREDRHIAYSWNGTRITGFYDKGSFRPL